MLLAEPQEEARSLKGPGVEGLGEGKERGEKGSEAADDQGSMGAGVKGERRESAGAESDCKLLLGLHS
jgi:hypothetical protein